MKSSKPKAEYSYWYPADRKMPDPLLPELERYPVKQKRKAVVPMDSEGHIVHDGKLLCGVSKTKAQKARGCNTGKTVAYPLSAISVCPRCIEVYKNRYTSETKRLDAWNAGRSKIF